MSSDRELLELAAKAAEIELQEWTGDDLAIPNHYWSPSLGEVGNYWNALESDGDALRLAVKLRIEPKQVGGEAWAVAAGEICKIEDAGANPYAATRRAIVRAAAAIGEAMP